MNRFLIALVAVATLGVAACNDDIAAPTDPNRRLVEIYAATIQAVATHSRPDLAEQESIDKVVYLASREGVTIDINVQAGIVVELEDWATIRFIDAIEEAIETGEPDAPVRDDGVLLGLGSIPEGVASVSVSADRYEGDSHLTVFDVELARRAGEWSVVEPLESTTIRLR